ncbi:MAG TPA: hypothetical protein DCW41_04500 [Clostridiales bacterium]|nr:hypothetical protein [Clostridiales bacterium]
MERGQKRKRIALLAAQPEEYRQAQFIRGFVREALKADMDVCVFSMFIKYQSTPGREIGDTSVFSLPDYESFDAVVVLGDTIQTPGAVSGIEDDLRSRYKGTVLFVDRESKYFDSVLIDNYLPIKKVVSHMIEVHGLRNIVFLTGKSWHPHSKIRQKAFIDAMTEHGIAVDDSMLYNGDFWYTSGESLANELCESGNPLPEGVCCANDCMAIGLAKGLINSGVKVPEQVKIAGYDTNEEGQHAPIPLTSAPIPSEEFGEYSFRSVIRKMNGEDIDVFVPHTDLFIGGSCGCGCTGAVPVYEKRENWDTDTSMTSVFSLFNNMDEDLMEQTSQSGLISTIFSYVYQIRNFRTLSICLNEGWETRDCVKDISKAFSDNISEIIRCDGREPVNDRVKFDDSFPKSVMIPELDRERDEARAFFFMPLFFEDRVFGYTALSAVDTELITSREYRAWQRSVMKGLEYFRRNDELIRGNQILRSEIVRENITGMYNYQGFINMGDTLVGLVMNSGGYMGALAVDIKGLSKINDDYGRVVGDKAIFYVSNILENVFSGINSYCYCIGNGEFIALRATSSRDDGELERYVDRFLAKIDEFNDSGTLPCKIEIYKGVENAAPECKEDIEMLVNSAISKKNGGKTEETRLMAAGSKLTEGEQIEANIVKSILNNDLISYHFQPIVSAATGDIVAYEALMRADTTPYLAPTVILKYAAFFNRLDDMEKSTFKNVLRTVDGLKDIFDGTRKIFINTIPGHNLRDEDIRELMPYFTSMRGSIVAEYTEQSELTDEALLDLKEMYGKIGLLTAIDDYGSGYSNVNNLLRYMPNYIKIDRLLLSNIGTNPQKQHFVKDIIQFSHDNGIKALAEGVETVDELRTVIKLGVDLIQGYYTARPSREPAYEIDKKVKEQIITFAGGGQDRNDTYVAGKENRISLVKLDQMKIRHIMINEKEPLYRDLIITGVPDMDFDIDININGGYRGVIIIENAVLKQSSGGSSFTISGRSEIVLIMKGENEFPGGIAVEEGSKVELKGVNTEDIVLKDF